VRKNSEETKNNGACIKYTGGNKPMTCKPNISGHTQSKCYLKQKVLVVHETETDDPSVVGEEAHIVAQKEIGPRGRGDLTPEQRDKYDNLILLCSVHHKVVDDKRRNTQLKSYISSKKTMKNGLKRI
jgi:hypothetical protein